MASWLSVSVRVQSGQVTNLTNQNQAAIYFTLYTVSIYYVVMHYYAEILIIYRL